jgi:hypothetical protein
VVSLRPVVLAHHLLLQLHSSSSSGAALWENEKVSTGDATASADNCSSNIYANEID